jgi:hypothetical protein
VYLVPLWERVDAPVFLQVYYQHSLDSNITGRRRFRIVAGNHSEAIGDDRSERSIPGIPFEFTTTLATIIATTLDRDHMSSPRRRNSGTSSSGVTTSNRARRAPHNQPHSRDNDSYYYTIPAGPPASRASIADSSHPSVSSDITLTDGLEEEEDELDVPVEAAPVGTLAETPRNGRPAVADADDAINTSVFAPTPPSTSLSQASLMEYSDTSDEYTRGARAYPQSRFQSAESPSPTRTHPNRLVRFSSLTSLATDVEHGEQASTGHTPERNDAGYTSNDRTPRSSPPAHWMESWAYSFRSPAPQQHHHHHHGASPRHRPTRSHSTLEYPHHTIPTQLYHAAAYDGTGVADPTPRQHPLLYSQPQDSNEASPLLATQHKTRGTATAAANARSVRPKSTDSGASRSSETSRGRLRFTKPLFPGDRRAIRMAAAFLEDYQHNRPPTLSSELATISDAQLVWVQYVHHGWMPWLRFLASAALFFSSGFEGFEPDVVPEYAVPPRAVATVLNLTALLVLFLDVYIRHVILYSYDSLVETGAGSHRHNVLHRVRQSRSLQLVRPLIVFGTVLVCENISRILITRDEPHMVLFTSVFKPLVLFYVSSQARDALEAVRRISRIVLRVLVMELLLILFFAAVAVRLYGHTHEGFADLSTSWFSLFELATTVTNPSLWMPLYNDSKTAAIFFVPFVVVTTFYLHSLVLSVVFSTYIQAATAIHARSTLDREDSVQLAYLALLQQQQRNDEAAMASSRRRKTQSATHAPGSAPPIPEPPAAVSKSDMIDVRLVRETLKNLRPHYNAMKINALVEIVDPSNQKIVDFATFRTKVRQALNASVRTARSATTLALSVELVAVAVAIVNFIYVILVSSAFNVHWFNESQQMLGSLITVVATFELLIRFNPLRIPDFTPLTRLNATFDGLALMGAVVSTVGIVMYVTSQGEEASLNTILMGRAIDMIRIMRFFQIFRDVVRRSSDVIPVLVGPLILVLTTLHVFVYTGMALWGGAIHVGTYEGDIVDLYDLNNFNSYQEGVVSMFNVLVVNDWHELARVFTFADRCASPVIVYPFFILGNLLGVSIVLNVLTAFFVETFVTKLDDNVDGSTDLTTVQREQRDFSIQTSEKQSVRRIASMSSLLGARKASGSRRRAQRVPEKPIDRGEDADSEASSESELFEFDVYEREGVDKIMQAVSGGANSNEFARQICGYLEIFETLTPGRETVGYLICDQQTLERYGNRRFQTKADGFLGENELHAVVSDVNSELLALSSRPSFDLDRSLVRTFPHHSDPNVSLEISASLLRRHPALSLFVSRTVDPALQITTENAAPVAN